MSIQLQEYCEQNGIDAEFIETTESTHSAAEAARVLQIGPEQIIKSLLFYVDDQPFVTVVRGPDRVSETRLAEFMDADTCRLADPDEVKTETGYEIGGVPPVGIDVPKIVDEHVLQYDTVYGGGGSKHVMIGIDPRFIIGENDVVANIT